ncbi:MAG: shikimate dehydrogenase [Gammaproteobacteria bacterium]|nr:shikimate dehydrogenase [Gammaproteobacteria bacterium]
MSAAPRDASTAGPPPDRYAVIGHPIAHSRSPRIHAAFAAAAGERLEYGRIDAPPEGFARAVHDFFEGGGRGLNVTLPHKEAAARLADRLTPRARLAGAVNTLARQADGSLLGDNTDGAGLMADLARLGIRVMGARVLVLGAGGATRGILGPLLEAGPALLVIANRTASRAAALATESGARVHGCGYDALAPFLAAGPFDLILHATALGLQGEAPPLPQGTAGPSSVAYDLGYGAGDTPFVRWARAQGVTRAEQGLGMLIEQAAEAFFLWRGVRPDTAALHRTELP